MLGQELRKWVRLLGVVVVFPPDALGSVQQSGGGVGGATEKEEMEVLGEAYSFNKLWDVMEEEGEKVKLEDNEVKGV